MKNRYKAISSNKIIIKTSDGPFTTLEKKKLGNIDIDL